MSLHRGLLCKSQGPVSEEVINTTHFLDKNDCNVTFATYQFLSIYINKLKGGRHLHCFLQSAAVHS